MPDKLPLGPNSYLIRDVDQLVAVNTQDITALREMNGQLFNRGRDLRRPSTQRHMRLVARFPENLYFELRQRFGSYRKNKAAWKRWLNDPDNQVFRTWHGKV